MAYPLIRYILRLLEEGVDAGALKNFVEDRVVAAKAAKTPVATSKETLSVPWEAAPGFSTRHLPDLTLSKEEYMARIKDKVLKDEEIDRFIEVMGGKTVGAPEPTVGVYQGKLSPAFRTEQGVQLVGESSAPERLSLHPDNVAHVHATEAARALGTAQEASAANLLLESEVNPTAFVVKAPFNFETAPNIERVVAGEFGEGAAIVPAKGGYAVLDIGAEGEESFASRFKSIIPKIPGAADADIREATQPRDASIYVELPWREGQATEEVLNILEESPLAPQLVARADSAEMRTLADDLAQVYQDIEARGEGTPNAKLVDVLKAWASEGLPGVINLVERGLAPAVVLGVFPQLYDEREQ